MMIKGGIRSFDGKCRVWIGGLPQKGEPDDALNEMLRQHMSTSGLNCVYAQVGKNGMGGAAFTNEMEAQQAIAVMNGTFFQGSIIQVDRLTKGNGSTSNSWKPSFNNGGGGGWSGGKGGGSNWGGKGGGSNWGGNQVENPMNNMMKQMIMMLSQQGKGNGKGMSKGKSGGIRSYDGKLRVWIGGLPQKGEPDDVLNKKLKEHMGSAGLRCVYAQVGKNGMGGAAFSNEQEVEQAILTMNGTIFEGAIIQVDRLTKGNK
eukprot:CAMPEP_0197621590 /NCGR_PEP_ID=MMETSP1338-20131121/2136_1 /TAXON_ID=43686 ORGANISM="Pelagodinium beii, Strain RCC1491" /NCGR_SAMPLE_ID=MMETSP1338 /ASSEMBLY_ACC=CAM_ASM_000754 /LENGTH=257 /DNA_ID=CAMNT_0043191101 /DNA_START=67 /DNA_END=840 /DNA_ORIENTATION=-